MQQHQSNQFNTFISAMLGVLLTILTVLCFIVPKGNEVLWVNGNFSAFTDLFFSLVSMSGGTTVFIAVVGALAFVRFNYSIVAGMVFILNSMFVLFLKQVAFPEMQRPIALMDNSLLHFVDGVDVQTLYSFPSGHTATAFAMAVTLSLLLKHRGLSVLLITLAVLVGYSRIYLLQHFLMDVTAGAFVGTITSFLVYYMRPVTLVHRFYGFAKGQLQHVLPSFIKESRRVKRWEQRVLSEG
jgi:membrane-associated phospholipid phosphatase